MDLVKNRMNAAIASKLNEVADLLESQSANPFRVNAYRRASSTVQNSNRAMSDIVDQEGLDGLDQLPGIGESLARTIFQLVKTGQLPMLERLRGASDPIEILQSVPGIGRKLAERLYAKLGIHSLEELEAAAIDGRLAGIEGFGQKRLKGIIDSLASRLGRVRKPSDRNYSTEPEVAELLDVDQEYLRRATAGELDRIAPRRFNPDHQAWLPVLHSTRGSRHYTALFSNTAHAHEAGKTQDWVVIYYDGGAGERQYTAITSERGQLEGRRIIRGRERECAEYYFVAKKGDCT